MAIDLPHRCDEWCVCPEHPDLPLFYAPAAREHACQRRNCKYAHGLETKRLEEYLGRLPERGCNLMMDEPDRDL